MNAAWKEGTYDHGKPVEVVHRPEGEPRRRYNSRQQRYEPMRGKEKCHHRRYITNRAGRILRDPDTGHLAEVRCRQIARFFTATTRGGSGFYYRHLERWCPKHFAEQFDVRGKKSA